jgi:hypothetical protein
MKIKKNYLVEKRNILNEMRSYTMSLQELRFLSIYLSKINARDSENTRIVRFPLSEFVKIMELDRIRANDIKPVIYRLLQKIVELPTETGGYEAFQLFKKCKVEQDNNNEWFVEINAHDDALPLMFNFQSHYFTYQLWNALRLTSPNHIRMYEILKQYEKKGERTLGLENLRELLGIKPDEYKGKTAWGNFNKWVLVSCQTALSEKTDIKFTYEPIRKGRGGKVTGVKFTITSNTAYVEPLNLKEFINLNEPIGGVVYQNGIDTMVTQYSQPRQIKFDGVTLKLIGEPYEFKITDLYSEYVSENKYFSRVCNDIFSEPEIIDLINIIREYNIEREDVHFGTILQREFNLFVSEVKRIYSENKTVTHYYKYFRSLLNNKRNAFEYEQRKNNQRIDELMCDGIPCLEAMEIAYKEKINGKKCTSI